MIGNHAIALGLVEAGLELVSACPATPIAGILSGIIELSGREKSNVYTELSTNEKCAFEVAYGAANMGRKAACLMKQAGLHVALPSVLHALEKPMQGALVLVFCDDPGSQYSQMEQDTRLLAALFRIHLFDPASPSEARDVAYHALHYSFEQKKPVILLSIAVMSESAKRARLSAGCPHRAIFFAVRCASPDAVFTGDTECSTLSIANEAVSSCIDKSGGVTMASGFYESFRQDNEAVPIIASVGHSTFLRTSLPALYDAVRSGKKFLLVIMDNGTKAAAGMHPLPQGGITVDGRFTTVVSLEGLLGGFGIDFVRILDPFDVPAMVQGIRDALKYLRDDADRPAVIIARRECHAATEGTRAGSGLALCLEDGCTGCRRCMTLFDCPALSFDETTGKVRVDGSLCTGCRVCLYTCPEKQEGKSLFQKKRRLARNGV
jgi:TPP-dependent indolepyruvate ferredoxin oxidoreductase alpha subunit